MQHMFVQPSAVHFFFLHHHPKKKKKWLPWKAAINSDMFLCSCYSSCAHVDKDPTKLVTSVIARAQQQKAASHKLAGRHVARRPNIRCEIS